MKVRLDHVTVEGTPDELAWFLDQDQKELRMRLEIMNALSVMNASVAVMPHAVIEEEDDEEDDGELSWRLIRGGKAPPKETPSKEPPPKGEDDS
jgi:hypothetical protein